MTAEFWEYDSRIGRRWNRDPIIKDYESPYSCLGNNPIWYADFDGADTTQRNKALSNAQTYVDLKEKGNQYKMGAKNGPGDKVDCSGLISYCVKAGGEEEPNRVKKGEKDKGSGVLNIEANAKEINPTDLQSGNLVTFRNEEVYKNGDKAYPYHIGIVTDFKKDDNGNITQITFIHSSGGIGPNKKTVSTTGEYAWGKVKIKGYYKWDSKPDATPVLQKATVETVQQKSSYPKFSLKEAMNVMADGLKQVINTLKGKKR